MCCVCVQLLCGLLNCACVSNVAVSDVEVLLESQVDWLRALGRNVRAACAAATAANNNIATETAATPTAATAALDATLLEGHLCVTRELLAFLTPEAKYHIGGDPTKGICLIKELIEDFIFPFSKVYLQLKQSTGTPGEQVNPVCGTQSTVMAAYELLVTLCTGCAPNLTIVAEMLTNMFYSEREESLSEWEYLPAVGPRPHRGFVGLKNAGATCYMNSVLQQLYMIRQVCQIATHSVFFVNYFNWCILVQTSIR